MLYTLLKGDSNNNILDDIDNERMSRGRIKNEVREAINQLNRVNRKD